MIQGLLMLLGMFICYVVGRNIMAVMGIGMIGSLAGIIFKPMIFGFFVILVGLGLIVLLFRGIFIVLGWIIGLVAACMPLVVVAGIIYLIVKAVKNK